MNIYPGDKISTTLGKNEKCSGWVIEAVEIQQAIDERLIEVTGLRIKKNGQRGKVHHHITASQN